MRVHVRTDYRDEDGQIGKISLGSNFGGPEKSGSGPGVILYCWKVRNHQKVLSRKVKWSEVFTGYIFPGASYRLDWLQRAKKGLLWKFRKERIGDSIPALDIEIEGMASREAVEGKTSEILRWICLKCMEGIGTGLRFQVHATRRWKEKNDRDSEYRKN